MSATCTHPSEGAGLAGGPLRDALSEAERLCAAHGERMTPARRRVLELLFAADGPVKAYDLMARFAGGGAPAKPPTVYRALDFLSRKGFVHRIESLNAYVACRGDAAAHAAAFLICDCCGAAAEIEPGSAPGVGAAATGRGYALRSLVVEAHGLCPACRGA